MKRLLFFLALCAVSFFGTTDQVQAGVNDFDITNYDIQYELSRDAEKHSQLKTVETITALFTIPNQNHGIERAIPSRYDGHKTHLKIESVTDEKGNAHQFMTYNSNGNTVVRIGDADRYVLGTVTYVITYTQKDVTRYFPDVNRDEFFWDTNGTDWRVPIHALSVSLHMDESLAPALTGEKACYQGVVGSTQSCTLNSTNTDFEVTANNLQSGENITMAIAFEPGTFAEYEPSLVEKFLTSWLYSLLISIPVSIILIVFLSARYRRWSNRTSERKPVVTEYLPPKGMSVTTSGSIVSGPRGVFTAQMLDLAVRHYIKIYQTREKSFWRKAEYEIEVVKDVSKLSAEEREILGDIFGHLPTVHSRLALKTLQNNTAVFNRMQDNPSKLKKLIRGEYGLRNKVPEQSRWFKRFGLVMLLLSLVLLNPFLLIVAITALVMSFTLWPLSDKGLELARYLDGLKQYISVAETERIKQLQSPEGAAKVGDIDVDNPKQLIKLYERVLPYAVLFGQEKEWNKQIGLYYESAGTQPSWYSGNNTTFNAAVFATAMSNFSTSASYSSASSSSSGGSSGGGFSGGGGGGGGGGGW